MIRRRRITKKSKGRLMIVDKKKSSHPSADGTLHIRVHAALAVYYGANSRRNIHTHKRTYNISYSLLVESTKTSLSK